MKFEAICSRMLGLRRRLTNNCLQSQIVSMISRKTLKFVTQFLSRSSKGFASVLPQSLKFFLKNGRVIFIWHYQYTIKRKGWYSCYNSRMFIKIKMFKRCSLANKSWLLLRTYSISWKWLFFYIHTFTNMNKSIQIPKIIILL